MQQLRYLLDDRPRKAEAESLPSTVTYYRTQASRYLSAVRDRQKNHCSPYPRLAVSGGGRSGDHRSGDPPSILHAEVNGWKSHQESQQTWQMRGTASGNVAEAVQ